VKKAGDNIPTATGCGKRFVRKICFKRISVWWQMRSLKHKYAPDIFCNSMTFLTSASVFLSHIAMRASP